MLVRLSASVLCLFLTSCVAVESGAVTYQDTNGDGRIDREYHSYSGADRNWELQDIDFDGRYDKRIYHDFAREEFIIDRPVPKS
jgi:hypothetical protein